MLTHPTAQEEIDTYSTLPSFHIHFQHGIKTSLVKEHKIFLATVYTARYCFCSIISFIIYELLLSTSLKVSQSKKKKKFPQSSNKAETSEEFRFQCRIYKKNAAEHFP